MSELSWEGLKIGSTRRRTDDLVRMLPCSLKPFLEQLLEQSEPRRIDTAHDVHILLETTRGQTGQHEANCARVRSRRRTMVSLNGAASKPMFPGLFESMKPKSMWMQCPSRSMRMFPLWRSLIWSRYVATE